LCTSSANVFDFFTIKARAATCPPPPPPYAAAIALHPDSFSIEKVRLTPLNNNNSHRVSVASMPRYDHGGMPPKPKEKGVNKVKLEVRRQH
jgi:hypothetical protein